MSSLLYKRPRFLTFIYGITWIILNDYKITIMTQKNFLSKFSIFVLTKVKKMLRIKTEQDSKCWSL